MEGFDISKLGFISIQTELLSLWNSLWNVTWCWLCGCHLDIWLNSNNF